MRGRVTGPKIPRIEVSRTFRGPLGRPVRVLELSPALGASYGRARPRGHREGLPPALLAGQGPRPRLRAPVSQGGPLSPAGHAGRATGRLSPPAARRPRALTAVPATPPRTSARPDSQPFPSALRVCAGRRDGGRRKDPRASVTPDAPRENLGRRTSSNAPVHAQRPTRVHPRPRTPDGDFAAQARRAPASAGRP